MFKAFSASLLLFVFSLSAQARIGHDASATPVAPKLTVAEVIEKALKQEYPDRPLKIESVIPGGTWKSDWMNKYIDHPISLLTSYHHPYKIKVALAGCQESSELAEGIVFFMPGYDRKRENINEPKNECIYTVVLYSSSIVHYLNNQPNNYSGVAGTKDIVVNICNQ